MAPLFNNLLLASLLDNRLWMALPLIVAISLVYGATRHEIFSQVLANAARFGLWILVFMGVIFALLAWVTWSL